jgi:hypothetical protein
MGNLKHMLLARQSWVLCAALKQKEVCHALVMPETDTRISIICKYNMPP